MTATATPSANGKPPRKQLADELNRLDGIIDALAEGLPGAVADACRDGARLAVKDAIVELLTNPELRALLAGLNPPAPPPAPPAGPTTAGPARPSVWTRLTSTVAAVKAAAVGKFTAVAAAVNTFVRPVAAVVPVRQVLLVGAGVGVAVGLVSYLCPHGLSAAIGAAGAACTAAAAQAAVLVRRSFAAFGLSQGD